MKNYRERFIQEVTPLPADEKKFEIHRRHRDIFIIVEGMATFYHTIMYEAITEYDPDRDIQKVNAPIYDFTVVKPGDVLIFEPGEAHKPFVYAGCQTVKFIIIKEVVV